MVVSHERVIYSDDRQNLLLSSGLHDICKVFDTYRSSASSLGLSLSREDSARDLPRDCAHLSCGRYRVCRLSHARGMAAPMLWRPTDDRCLFREGRDRHHDWLRLPYLRRAVAALGSGRVVGPAADSSISPCMRPEAYHALCAFHQARQGHLCQVSAHLFSTMLPQAQCTLKFHF